MGTISDKLTYLNTTKSQLKDMINYGLDDDNKITSSTTFRNYVTSVFKAFLESLNNPSTLFNNLPKITGTGSNITLNDTANAPMRIMLNATEITQDGTPTPDSPQDIHTISGSNKVVVCGKNLFNKLKAVSNYRLDSNGNLFANDDYFTSDFIEVKPNTIYRTNIEPTIYKRICEYNSSKTFLTNKDNPNTNYITTSPTTKFIKVAGLLTELDTTMVYEGSTFLTYEPYISQTAEVNLKSKNLFDKNGTLNNGYLASDGSVVSSSNYKFTDYLPIKPNTYYATIGMATGTGNAPSRCYYDENKNLIIGYAHLEQAEILNASPSNAYYMRESVKIADYDTIKIYQAPYYDYGEYCKIGNYEDKFIRTSGKNKFNINANRTNNNTTNSVNGNVLTVTSTSSWASMDYLNISLPNNTYTLSFDWKSSTTLSGTDARIYVYDNPTATGSLGAISPTGTSGHLTLTFTNTNNAITIRFSPNNSGTVKTTSIDFSNIQINEGSTALPYEPYGNETWYIKKNIGKKVFDGTESYSMASSGSIRIAYETNIDDIESYTSPNTTPTLMSNRFTPISYNGTWKIGNISRWTNRYSIVLIVDPSISTITDFKTWLTSNNVIVYYPLATPTYTKITGTLAEQLEHVYQLLKSYKGVTNISQVNNDLPFELDVQAIENME